ncbi:TlpA family protein disulfide reductase [Sulfidibacter corallicola]|uniref:TlpA family protein disulfide reductase n=1 Tax=Sulfidibacter corallicola TaxID=2818388 RepID=A0A8A4TIX7_SULCO|nr:TlpA disulfide reductase family protein [Sulfidibacter corallicola]QTD49979.1 TlpA family protein disulfide reductase [Sulfidibacter corallicola]
MRHVVRVMLFFFLIGLGCLPVSAQTGDWRIREIQDRFKKIEAHCSALELEQVRTQLKSLGDEYPEVKRESAFQKMASDITFVGKDAGSLKVKMWFQGEAKFEDSPVTLVLFWEEWCPHCRDEIGHIQDLFQRYHEKGVNVVALTRITEKSTVTSVISFLTERDLTFSIAREDGTMSDRFGVFGVPAAALVKDGKIIWRGPPKLLADQTLTTALSM